MDIITDQDPNINIYNTDDIKIQNNQQKEKELTKFSQINELKQNQEFLAHLTKLNFIKLTPIQQEVIPVLLTNSDTILSSQTGSGKTLSFLIPLVLKLNSHANITGIRAVILSPTRELAVQTHRVLKQLISYQPVQNRLRLALITGGESLNEQFTVLSQNIDVIIACPGRFQYIIQQVKQIEEQLKSVMYVVIDECDQMFEQQLIDQVTWILQKFTRPQIVLCSATLPDELNQFSDANLKKPKLIQNQLKTFPEKLAIFNIYVSSQEKDSGLIKVIQQCFQKDKCKILIFVASQYHCVYLESLLQHFQYKVSHINRQLDQTMRNMLIRDFNNDVYDILISTDLTARGIDIPSLKVVINYNFPTNFQTYLNRGGRTARNDQYGILINLLDESELCYAIERSRQAGKQVFMHDIIDLDRKMLVIEKEILTEKQNIEQINIKQIKEMIQNRFNQLSDQQKIEQKQKFETTFKICKEVIHSIKQYPEIIQSVQQYRNLCTFVKVNDLHGIDCFTNNVYVNSSLNNNFGCISQQILDQLQNIIGPIAQNIQSRQSMINSMIQIRKQMKDAEQRCVDEAKQYINQINHKRILSIFFDLEQQQNIQDIIDEEKLHEIQTKLLDIQPSIQQLQQKAVNGDKQAYIQLQIQKQLDEKKYIKEEAQKMIVKENEQVIQPNLKYNNPKMLMEMDEMIKLQKNTDNIEETQLVSSKPTQNMQDIEIKIVNTKNEQPKKKLPVKIWNKDKQRYVNRDLYDERGRRKKNIKKEDKQKDMYQEWKQKSGLTIQTQGIQDNTNAKQSHNMLKFQGMSRQMKRKFQNSQSSLQTTTLKDKQKLNMELVKDRKDAGKKVGKAQKIQQIAQEVKRQGKSWQKEKQKFQRKQMAQRQGQGRKVSRK